MSNPLDLLRELEAENEKNRRGNQAKAKSTKASKSRPSSVQSRAPPPRPRPLSSHAAPPPKVEVARPAHSAPATPRVSSERSRSRGPDSRRISFVEPRKPSIRPLTIFSKSAALSSGFPFVPKLNKFGLSQREWEGFVEELLEAADVSKKNPFYWFFKKGEVTQRIKRELQYGGGELRAFLTRSNKGFRKRGFMASLELPSDRLPLEEGATEDEKKQAKKDAKKWRIVLQPGNSSSASIYSKTSLADSVSREATLKKQQEEDDLADEVNRAFPNVSQTGDRPQTTSGKVDNHGMANSTQSNGVAESSVTNENEKPAVISATTDAPKPQEA